MVFVVEIRDSHGAIATKEYDKRSMADALNAARFDLGSHQNCSIWSVSVKGSPRKDQ